MAKKVTRGALKLKKRYTWKRTKGDTPATREDAALFNRREGYEVVAMIQKVADELGLATQADLDHIESLIANDLPGNVRGRKKVFDWLVTAARKDRG